MSQVRTSLGWGVALLVLGAVLLLRATGALDEGMAAWPWAVLAAGVALLAHPSSRGVSRLTAPVVLLVAGGVFALREVGALARVPLVPLLLVLAGAGLLATGLRGDQRGLEQEPGQLPLEGATRARVVVGHGAGTLRIAGGAAPGLAYEGAFTGGIRPAVHRDGELLEATLRQRGDLERLLRARRTLDWDLRLSDTVPTILEVRTGASQVRLDLTETAVESLLVQTGASDVSIVAPARGRCRVRVDAGAAEVEVRLPPGVVGAVRVRSALASVEVDEHRFPRHGDGFRSADYDEAAENLVEVELEGGVASFSVR